MFDDLDGTIRELLIRKIPLDVSEVDVTFDAPDREWSGRLTRPTINCFLYDVRDNDEMRKAADITSELSSGTVSQEFQLWINTTYNVTAWARALEDEHRLLWRVLRVLLRYPALPAHLARGELKDWAFPILTRVGRPEQAGTSATDLWKAIDNRIRPSLTFTATLAVYSDITVRLDPLLELESHRPN